MTTTFHSTRSTTDSLTAKQAIRKGIADDGGLFVSDALGKTKVDVASLPGKSYQQIAAEVLGALLPDFTAEELGQCIADAYGEQWSDERITPLKPLGDDYVLELFNGPTSAFKAERSPRRGSRAWHGAAICGSSGRRSSSRYSC